MHNPLKNEAVPLKEWKQFWSNLYQIIMYGTRTSTNTTVVDIRKTFENWLKQIFRTITGRAINGQQTMLITLCMTYLKWQNSTWILFQLH
jgi:hypothetical protein